MKGLPIATTITTQILCAHSRARCTNALPRSTAEALTDTALTVEVDITRCSFKALFTGNPGWWGHRNRGLWARCRDVGLLTAHQGELATTNSGDNGNDSGQSRNESSHRTSYGVDLAVGNERLGSDPFQGVITPFYMPLRLTSITRRLIL